MSTEKFTKILNDTHKLLLETYSKEGLKCLRGGKDDNYHLRGRNILVWHSNACSKIKDESFISFKNIDNLLYYSDSVMYCTGNLFLLRPLISDFHVVTAGDKKVYTLYESLSDRRYYLFAEIVYEKLYAYWSQIAHILKARFIPEKNSKQIYFTSIIKSIDDLNINSDNFKWLKEFCFNEYQELNKDRIDIVHNLSLETAFRHNHAMNSTDYEKLSIFMQKKNNLPTYFKQHIEDTLTGFEKALDFVLE